MLRTECMRQTVGGGSINGENQAHACVRACMPEGPLVHAAPFCHVSTLEVEMNEPVGGRAEGTPLGLYLGAYGLRAQTGKKIDYNGPATPGRNGRNGRAKMRSPQS